jgi:hypothetical protein
VNARACAQAGSRLYRRWSVHFLHTAHLNEQAAQFLSASGSFSVAERSKASTVRALASSEVILLLILIASHGLTHRCISTSAAPALSAPCSEHLLSSQVQSKHCDIDCCCRVWFQLAA